MNYFDIVIGLILAYSAYRGYTKGLIIQVATLAALILGIIGAIQFSSFTAEFLTDQFNWTTEYLPLIAFIVTFLAIVFAVHLVAKVVDNMVEAVALGMVNRLLGVAFSILKTAFILSIVIVIFESIDRKYHFLPDDKIAESYLYNPVAQLAPRVFPYLQFDDIKGRIENSIDMDIAI